MVKRTAPSPRNVIRKYGEHVLWHPHTGEADESGHTVHRFDGPFTIVASIRPPTSSAHTFDIGALGPDDTATYLMDVIDEDATGGIDTATTADDTTPAAQYGRNVDEGDRIEWMGDSWRAIYRRRARRNGFSRFVLVEDDRDRHTDSTTEGPDDDPDGGTTDDGWTVA